MADTPRVNPGEAKAFTVPCATCGAPLHLDFDRGRVHCTYCQRETDLKSDVLRRAHHHLAELAKLETEAAQSASDADFERQRRRLGLRWLQPLFPLLVGLYIIVGLGVGGASQFAVVPFLTPHLGEQPAGFIGGTLALVIWGAFVALPLMLRAKRRKVSLSRPATLIGAVSCAGCGASVPVVYGREMACPFCGAHLIADETAQCAEERIARGEVIEQRTRARVARAEADRAHAGESEQVLKTTIPIQLLMIGFAIALAVVIGIVKLLFHV